MTQDDDTDPGPTEEKAPPMPPSYIPKRGELIPFIRGAADEVSDVACAQVTVLAQGLPLQRSIDALLESTRRDVPANERQMRDPVHMRGFLLRTAARATALLALYEMSNGEAQTEDQAKQLDELGYVRATPV